MSTLHALIGKSLVRAETTPAANSAFCCWRRSVNLPWSNCGRTARKRCCASATMPPICNSSAPAIAICVGQRRQPGLRALEPEQDNLRAALQWTLDEGHYEDVAWLMVAVDWFWLMRGHWYEAGKWLAQLLPHRQALATDLRLADFDRRSQLCPRSGRVSAAGSLDR